MSAAQTPRAPLTFTPIEGDAPALFSLEPAPPRGRKPKRAMLASAGLYGDEGDPSRTLDGNFFPTPHDATRALIRSLTTPGAGPVYWGDFVDWAWWETACGEGHVCRVLEERGVREIYATDLADRGYGTPGVDFTRAAWPAGADPKKTGIITNPPYERHLCPAFIRHAVVDLGAQRVAMLLKSTYWHAAERQGLFNECRPAAIYPLTWRLDFTGEGSPALETAWMVWDAQAPDGWPPTCPLVKSCDTGSLFD